MEKDGFPLVRPNVSHPGNPLCEHPRKWHEPLISGYRLDEPFLWPIDDVEHTFTTRVTCVDCGRRLS